MLRPQQSSARFHRRIGGWPQQNTKPRGIPGTNGETWLAVNAALLAGQRGLPGGSSLARVLKEHRGVCNPGDKRCSGNQPQICDSTGQWVPNGTCATTCLDGGVCLGGG